MCLCMFKFFFLLFTNICIQILKILFKIFIYYLYFMKFCCLLLQSQNGTYVSGRKLKPGETRPLQCGDIIFLGPPSEMPEAFCYDDAFVDDEDMPEFGHEIIELPPVCI